MDVNCFACLVFNVRSHFGDFAFFRNVNAVFRSGIEKFYGLITMFAGSLIQVKERLYNSVL